MAALESAGVDLFNVSTRSLCKAEWEHSPLPLACWVEMMTSKPVIAAGSIGMNIDLMQTGHTDKEETQPLVESLSDAVDRFGHEEFDMLAVGRGIICDPHFVNKVRDGRFSEVRPFKRKDLSDFCEMGEDLVPEEIKNLAKTAD